MSRGAKIAIALGGAVILVATLSARRRETLAAPGASAAPRARAATAQRRVPPAARRTAVAPSRAAGGQTLQPGYARAVISATQQILAGCYERALDSAPALAGTLDVAFTIVAAPGTGGVVRSLRIAAGRTLDRHPTLRPCVARALGAQRFAPPASGPVEVSRTFTLSP